MRTDWKAQGLGALLALAALGAVVWVAEPLGGVLAFGLATVGLFLFVVVADRAVPAHAVQALVEAQSEQLAELREAFGLAGRPVYVPDLDGQGGVRLFLPSTNDERSVPVLDEETKLYSGAAGTLPGLALRPGRIVDHAPGVRVEMAEMEGRLAGALAGADLAHGLSINLESDGRLKADFRAGALSPPCLASPEAPDCLETGCALCQEVGCSLAGNVQRPLAADAATIRGRQVTIWFKAGQETAVAREPSP